MGRIEKKRQGGFTLIELIVVIAILGVLAAITVPTIANFLSSSKSEAYKAESDRIQAAVDGFYSAPGNSRFIGKRQFPLIGRGQTTQADFDVQTTSITLLDTGDPFTPQDHDGDGGSSTAAVELWNPVGGTEGSTLTTSTWTDDGDGEREIASDSDDTFTSVTVTRGGVTYHTDPRYFFVDFEVLVTDGLLDAVPESAGLDNKPSGSSTTYTGSYSWYVDANGKVQSLYRHLPSTLGFETDVFP